MHQVPQECPGSSVAAAVVKSLLIPAPPQYTAVSQLAVDAALSMAQFAASTVSFASVLVMVKTLHD